MGSKDDRLKTPMSERMSSMATVKSSANQLKAEGAATLIPRSTRVS